MCDAPQGMYEQVRAEMEKPPISEKISIIAFFLLNVLVQLRKKQLHAFNRTSGGFQMVNFVWVQPVSRINRSLSGGNAQLIDEPGFIG